MVRSTLNIVKRLMFAIIDTKPYPNGTSSKERCSSTVVGRQWWKLTRERENSIAPDFCHRQLHDPDSGGRTKSTNSRRCIDRSDLHRTRTAACSDNEKQLSTTGLRWRARATIRPILGCWHRSRRKRRKEKKSFF